MNGLGMEGHQAEWAVEESPGAAEQTATVQYADGDVETWLLDPPLLAAARIRAAHQLVPRPDSAQAPLQQRPDFLFAGLRAKPFWPSETFPHTVAILEAAAPAIRGEVLAMLAGIDDSESGLPPASAPKWRPHQEGLHEGVWQKLELWSNGRPMTEHCSLAHHTFAAVAAVPDAMREAPGRAALSLMLPGTIVQPHCGPTNHRLRLHLPVLLPGGALTFSGLTVAGETQAWVRDKCLVFDDSFEHKVELPTIDMTLPFVDLVRVVLIVDLWHPDAECRGLRTYCSM